MISIKIFFFLAILGVTFTMSSKIGKKKTLTGIQMLTSNIQTFEINWHNTGFQGNDVGCGSQGDIYVVGLDGRLWFYNFLNDFYTVVEGDIPIPAISRVDVNSDGTPYVVTSCGTMYYLNCNNRWIQLPGCGTDVGVGRGNEVWKIGCDDRAGGYGIWKLICISTYRDESQRECTRFRPSKYQSDLQENPSCIWYRIEGGAVRIDVDNKGNPWVLNAEHVLHGYDGINWLRVDGVLAQDLTVSNDDLVLVAALNGKIYVAQNPYTNLWIQLSGSGTQICASCFSQPWVVGNDNYIMTTTKFDFN
jgi:hypothetical protein